MKIIFYLTIASVTILFRSPTVKAHNSLSRRGHVKSIERAFNDKCTPSKGSGYICINCETLGLCVNKNGVWEPIIVEACDTNDGYMCNAVLGSCSNSTGPCNPKLENFPCSAEGVFPDPYDCQSYYVCFASGPSIVAMHIECEESSAFNPRTGDCSLSVTPEFCNVYAFECEKPGDKGAWRLNPNIFYICVLHPSEKGRVLVPQLYRCPDLQVFDGEKCVSEISGTTTTTTLSSSSTTTSSPGEFTCPGPGLYPDGTSCNGYYHCDTSLTARKYFCPSGTRFDPSASACVIGNC